jgi:hypothetical protein
MFNTFFFFHSRAREVKKYRRRHSRRYSQTKNTSRKNEKEIKKFFIFIAHHTTVHTFINYTGIKLCHIFFMMYANILVTKITNTRVKKF